MKKILVVLMAVLLSQAACAKKLDIKQTPGGKQGSPPAFKLEKSKLGNRYSFKNLTLIMVNAKSELDAKKYISLGSALAKKLVEVKETGNVSQLTVSNNSKEFYIFINAGDIVKGGKQDRTLRYDLIVPPGASNVPLPSFCVESGRWRQREGEDVKKFSSNTHALSSRRSRIASKKKGSQGEVWKSVAEQQESLNKNIAQDSGRKVEVRNRKSKSSLQLTLENKELNKLAAEYKKFFSGVIDKEQEAVGFIFLVNNQFNTMDVYNSKGLFRELWSKLLSSAVTEAISEGRKPAAAKSDELLLQEINSAYNEFFTLVKLNSATSFKTYENRQVVMFETIDDEEKKYLHLNIISKPPEEKVHRKNCIRPVRNRNINSLEETD